MTEVSCIAVATVVLLFAATPEVRRIVRAFLLWRRQRSMERAAWREHQSHVNRNRLGLTPWNEIERNRWR